MAKTGWIVRVCAAAISLLATGYGQAAAQTVEFLPEADAHLTLNSMWRTYLQAKDDRDAGATSQFSIGPSVQLYLKPLTRLKKVALFDLDETKKRVLVLEVGYRYLTGPGITSYNRMEPILTFNVPIGAGFLLNDRNRADLDWKNSGFVWRYRNKLTIERTVAVGSYHLIPYAAVEPFYESQYQKWSTTALYAGCLLPVGKHVQLNPYYEHQNNTGKAPNTQQNSVGLVMNLYFALPDR